MSVKVFRCGLHILCYYYSNIHQDVVLQRELNHPHPPNIIRIQPCQGLAYLWDLGSPYRTYPFSMHDSTSRVQPGYTLVSVDPANSLIYIRSGRCSGEAREQTLLCLSCQNIGPLADTVKEHARKEPVNLSFISLSHAQAQKRLDGAEKMVKKQRFDVCILNLSSAHSLYLFLS
jgi:hypothetical protein